MKINRFCEEIFTGESRISKMMEINSVIEYWIDSVSNRLSLFWAVNESRKDNGLSYIKVVIPNKPKIKISKKLYKKWKVK